MALTAVEKAAVVADYQTAEGDTGSSWHYKVTSKSITMITTHVVV